MLNDFRNNDELIKMYIESSYYCAILMYTNDAFPNHLLRIDQ